ncbi:TM2 domain-containing protein [Pedobacter sp. UBA4863]|uniref:TM2 domain-containing protein n=1 Tax=Pedobacter sp. UBA4863 TaxID=1947060 RepID=UPI0025D7C164|nr:TM2 domain-containing protein [Pedobacter sp. UBA4863]
MTKIKIKTLVIALAIISVVVPASWAAFPVEKNRTENTKNVTTATAPVNTDAKTSGAKEVTSRKAIAKAEKNSLLNKFKRAGGKSQLIALLLVILVGGLGIHRFYLGYTWQGVVQLLTLGGCGIWALIDLIRIITGDLQPKDGSYDQTL